MRRDWKQYLKQMVAWSGIASSVLPSLWPQAEAARDISIPLTKDGEPVLDHVNEANPLPLTFTLPVNEDVQVLIAGHRSHRSHSSHRSHYSSSGGGGYYTPSYSSPSYSPSPSPSYSYPSYPTPNSSSLSVPSSSYESPATGSKTRSSPAQLVQCNPNASNKPSDGTIQVMKVQLELMKQGYYLGSVDGIAGPVTKEALRCFQQHNNLPETSEMDTETLQKLKVVE